ncbi:putative quinol monooxygenase [Vibrio paucivorans]|uniref:Antibiotic biosynthesis monooxygenase n=1 Tax=Vibrio paucivorans TaxID=2829489 RepID=A0A9X3CHB9_9VIBR|nr:antibiotic biosynthesis monooxygenase [Vibrio paucivorans]MCW8335873.1 antibiotic biosynthesis monooxygenase [Vibrio paucivorans]
MSQVIFVTAELKMSLDRPRDEVVELIEQFCCDMRSEQGCLSAIATYDDKDPQRVVLLESYQDRAAIEAHFTMPHTQVFIDSQVAELVQAFETKQKGEVVL